MDIKLTDEQLKKLERVTSLDELKTLAEKEGVQANNLQLKLLWQQISTGGKVQLLDKNEELENVAGGCGDEEYSVGGNYTHSCPSEDNYEYVYRLIPTAYGYDKDVTWQYCGSCSHFTPNEADDWLGPGICRR